MEGIGRLFYWYFSKKALPYWCIALFDCAMIFASLMLMYILNNGVVASAGVFWPLCLSLIINVACFAVWFKVFHIHSGIIRYSSFVDLSRVGLAMCAGLATALLYRYTLAQKVGLPELRVRDLVAGAALATTLMSGMRVLVKHLYDSLYRNSGAQKAFIFGVREGGVAIAKSIRNQDPSRFVVAGFASSDVEEVGKILMGVKVYAFDENLVSTMRSLGATALFVSPLRSTALREQQTMIDKLIKNGIKLYMMPDEQLWNDSDGDMHRAMKEVKVEDLLPREEIKVDLEGIARQLAGKRILITGAAGSIGSEIVRQVALFNPGELILIDQAETPLHDIRLMMSRDFPYIKAQTIVANIANRPHMEAIFRRSKPEYIFHAAAYKHVPMMEDNPAESVANNVNGTKVMADLAVECGCAKFVMVSTDKAVNPTNIMGCSKRICEIYVQSLDKAIKSGLMEGQTQFVTTRFGNVLGSNGSVIPLFREQIKKGGPLTVTHPDIIRYFMLIPEACKLVLEAGTMGHGGEIFVFDMGNPVRIADLAQRMIQLSGSRATIKYVGLRPGEKLYEEVLSNNETTLPTFHDKIKIAKVREYNYDEISHAIDELIDHCFSETDMEVVARMKQIVPEFKSRNSVYEQLDR